MREFLDTDARGVDYDGGVLMVVAVAFAAVIQFLLCVAKLGNEARPLEMR